jgi:predicted enzyme related to lactoylglutathione lyase
MITHVKLVGLFVRDQDSALDFYSNKLGFEVLANEPYGDGARWIEVAPPGAQTRLALSKPPKDMEDRVGKFSQIIFTCEDVRATYEELRQRGVTFTQEPDEQPWGVHAQFSDPDGNTFVLASS